MHLQQLQKNKNKKQRDLGLIPAGASSHTLQIPEGDARLGKGFSICIRGMGLWPLSMQWVRTQRSSGWKWRLSGPHRLGNFITVTVFFLPGGGGKGECCIWVGGMISLWILAENQTQTVTHLPMCLYGSCLPIQTWILRIKQAHFLPGTYPIQSTPSSLYTLCGLEEARVVCKKMCRKFWQKYLCYKTFFFTGTS